MVIKSRWFRKYATPFLVLVGLVFIGAFLHSPKSSAAAICSYNGTWVQVNVYMRIIHPDGSVSYSTNFQFNVTASVPPGSSAAPYLDQTVAPNGGHTQNITATGHTHDCSGSPNGVQPAYDFTDASNGNFLLNCLGGAVHGEPINSASFSFTALSPGSAAAGGSWVGATSVAFHPTTTQDLNYANQKVVVFTYREPSSWSLTSTAAANKTTVYPGEVVHFSYNTKNNGPGPTSTFQYGNRIQYHNGATNGTIVSIPAANLSTTLSAGASTTAGDAYDLLIPSTIVADKVCSWRIFTPKNSTGAPNGTSSQVCVSIIKPVCGSMSVSPAQLDSTAKFTVRASVNSNGGVAGGNAINASSNFYIHIRGPGFSYTNNNIGSAGNGTLTNTAGVLTGTTPQIGPTNNTGTYLVQWGYVGPVGAINCGNEVTPTSGATFPVDNYPYFQVMGGDTAAGAGFKSGMTACSLDTTADVASWNYDNNPAGQYYGAGTQNAVLALRNIKSFVTGQDPLANQTPAANRTGTAGLQLTTPHDLSFANGGAGVVVNDNAGQYGGSFGSLPCLDDYASTITTGTSGAVSASTSKIYQEPNNFVLGSPGSPFTVGLDSTTHKGVVIKVLVQGDVHINGDILYDDSAGAGAYPRLDLVATGNIYVASNVTELHGAFVAQGGTFATCYNTATSAETTDYDTCNRQLKVYGSVAAKTIHLERTYSTLTNSNGAAEEFHYTPELWLSTPDCIANPSDSACSGGGTGMPSWDAVSGLPPTL